MSYNPCEAWEAYLERQETEDTCDCQEGCIAGRSVEGPEEEAPRDQARSEPDPEIPLDESWDLDVVGRCPSKRSEPEQQQLERAVEPQTDQRCHRCPAFHCQNSVNIVVAMKYQR